MYFNPDVYFASYNEGDSRYLDALIDKLNIYRRYCEASGKLSKWQRALQNYFGVSSDGTKASGLVTRGGDSGQLTMAKVNDYRNLVQHQLILITSQRPAGEAKAINSDPIALRQARIGGSLIEYYLSQVGYEQKFVRNAEIALICEESFTVLDWDFTAGDPIRPDVDPMTGEPNGKNVMTGDMVLRVISPWNLARDPYLQSPEAMQWGIYSWRENKFDLAAKFPGKADSIIKGNSQKIKEITFNAINESDTDQTEVHCLAHAKSPSVPEGRLTLFTGEEILLDGPFPYNEFNIYRMSQNDAIDSCFGYSNNNDLLALEEVTDALHSVIISNNTAFGAQCIIGPKGANLDHTQFSRGFAYFEVEPSFVDKIKPLQLTKTAPETYNYLNTLDRKKETLAGVNSVVRGDPEKALAGNSGSAMALVQAQSIQFNSGGQRSWYQLLGKSCTGMILMLQKYAQTERVIRITGKVQGEFLQEFKYSSQDLDKVSAVVFEMTNPLEKTIGGKEGLAKDLLQNKMIKNARQYVTLARTGSFDAFIEDDEADELALKGENERLRDGKGIQVVKTENHKEHIQTHMSIIASPESKDNTELVQATLDHIDTHTDWWCWLSVNDPALLIATNQQVLPMGPGMPRPGGPTPGTPAYKQWLTSPPPQLPQQAPGVPPPGPGGPPPQAMPHPPQHAPQPNAHGHQSMPKMMNPQPPGAQQAANIPLPNLPRMPVNPLTGERPPIQGAPIAA